MKNIKKNILTTVFFILLFASANVDGNAKEVSLLNAESFIHIYLQKSFNLPDGPATKMASFYLEGTGAFFILNCDLSFNKRASNPFAPQKNKDQKIMGNKQIIVEMKKALLSAKKYLNLKKNDKIFLVVIDSKVFNSPFVKNKSKKIYKVGMVFETTNINNIRIY
jgi:hypothetical protein